ncbi:MAG: hypothetical protein PVH88_27585 [Ignavibacteria bacterium]|jgi:hypothetical protein
MANAEDINRNFTISDADMLQASRVMHGIFSGDKASFTAFDAAFDDPFADNWLQKINDCSDLGQDSSYLDSQVALTKGVESKMEECRSFYSSMKYFVETAFPGKKEIWLRFGFDDYDKARRNETKMIRFLGVLYQTAEEYKTELTAAGFGEEKIEQIKTLQSELTSADYEQEMSKKKRPVVTQERVETMNECYAFMQKVSKAGKIIFVSDHAKYEQYLLPNERSAKKEEETTEETETEQTAE